MKNQLRKFKIIEKKFDLSSFYNIEVSNYRIVLMARFDHELTKKIIKIMPEPKIDSNGFISFEKNNIKIVLT